MKGLRAEGPEKKGVRPWTHRRVVWPRSDNVKGPRAAVGLSGWGWSPQGCLRGLWSGLGSKRLWAALGSQRASQGLLGHLWGLWAGSGARGASHRVLGWAEVSRGVPGESEPPVEAVARAGVPRSVPEALGWTGITGGIPGGLGRAAVWGGRLRGLCAGPGPDPQRSPRGSGRAGVADGGGAPPPHIKAGGAAG